MTTLPKRIWYRRIRNVLCCLMALECAWLAVQWWSSRREELIYLFFSLAILATGFAIEWFGEKRASN